MNVPTRVERQLYFNVCDPFVALREEGDARYVPLDDSADGESVRGADWVEEIAGVLELSSRPVCALFTGLPGTGKTTTLHRLMHRLTRGDARFFCVYIDVDQRLDVHTPIDIPDVLITVASELERAVLRAENRDDGEDLREGYLTRLWAWLKTLDPEFERFEVSSPAATPGGPAGAPPGPAAMRALKHVPALREMLRRHIADSMSLFLTDVRREIAQLHDRVMRTCRPEGGPWGGVVVVVDSLEKLRGSQSNFEEVLASAERLFSDNAEDLRLVTVGDAPEGAPHRLVHAVYTLPAALTTRQAIFDLKFLPMIKLRDEWGAEHAPGVAMARRLIRARIPDDALLKFLSVGPDDLEELLRRIIMWSGGYPREIIRMLRILTLQTRPVDAPTLLRLLTQEGDTYRRTVPRVALQWLAQVAVTHRLTFDDDAERPIVDQMLANNVVLRYQNSHEWFDVHPALFDLEAFRDMVAKLRGAVAGPSGSAL